MTNNARNLPPLNSDGPFFIVFEGSKAPNQIISAALEKRRAHAKAVAADPPFVRRPEVRLRRGTCAFGRKKCFGEALVLPQAATGRVAKRPWVSFSFLFSTKP